MSTESKAGQAGKSRVVALLTTLTEMLRSRVELLSLEVREQRAQLTQGLVWLAAAGFFALAALVFLSLALILFFREHAVLASTLLGVFYLCLTLILIWRFRKRQAAWSPPFASTVDELKKDCEWLQSQK